MHDGCRMGILWHQRKTPPWRLACRSARMPTCTAAAFAIVGLARFSSAVTLATVAFTIALSVALCWATQSLKASFAFKMLVAAAFHLRGDSALSARCRDRRLQ